MASARHDVDDDDLSALIAPEPVPEHNVEGMTTMASSESASASAAASLPSMAQGRAGPRVVDPKTLSHWVCLYPVYFNVTKKVSEGRRLPRSALTGLEIVSPVDIAEACGALGYTSIFGEVSGVPNFGLIIITPAGFHGPPGEPAAI